MLLLATAVGWAGGRIVRHPRIVRRRRHPGPVLAALEIDFGDECLHVRGEEPVKRLFTSAHHIDNGVRSRIGLAIFQLRPNLKFRGERRVERGGSGRFK